MRCVKICWFYLGVSGWKLTQYSGLDLIGTSFSTEVAVMLVKAGVVPSSVGYKEESLHPDVGDITRDFDG